MLYYLLLLPLIAATPIVRRGDDNSASSSPTSTSNYSPTPYTYTPPSVTLSTVYANPAISDSSYTDLTNRLPMILQNAVSISTHSWELGTLTQSLLEVYNPALAVFEYNSSAFYGDVPWPMLEVTLASLGDYNFSGSPSDIGDAPDNYLADYLDVSSTPTKLLPQALAPGDGALGDPCALGPAVWVLAKFAGRDDLKDSLGARESADYAWAVGNQLELLREGPTSANGKSTLYFCPLSLR